MVMYKNFASSSLALIEILILRYGSRIGYSDLIVFYRHHGQKMPFPPFPIDLIQSQFRDCSPMNSGTTMGCFDGCAVCSRSVRVSLPQDLSLEFITFASSFSKDNSAGITLSISIFSFSVYSQRSSVLCACVLDGSERSNSVSTIMSRMFSGVVRGSNAILSSVMRRSHPVED